MEFGIGIDKVLCWYSWLSGKYVETYSHSDALGSIYGLTDDTANIVEYYEYDIYGAPTIYDIPDGQVRHSSAYANRYLFTGREYHTATELYYYRARWYSPPLGRFLQRDPTISFLYPYFVYVWNAPVNYIDPTGLERVADFIDCEDWFEKQPTLKSKLKSAVRIAHDHLMDVWGLLELRFVWIYTIKNNIVGNALNVYKENLSDPWYYKDLIEFTFDAAFAMSYRGLDLECECVCDEGLIAYVSWWAGGSRDFGYNIHLCPPVKEMSKEEIASFIIHECAHIYFGGTEFDPSGKYGAYDVQSIVRDLQYNRERYLKADNTHKLARPFKRWTKTEFSKLHRFHQP